MVGCNCVDTCGDDTCPCFSLPGLDVANECGSMCACGIQCGNRFTQNGISVRLKIVRVRRKGWALCADQFIHRGDFICEYAGMYYFNFFPSFS